jgi:hypothetical protein
MKLFLIALPILFFCHRPPESKQVHKNDFPACGRFCQGRAAAAFTASSLSRASG